MSNTESKINNFKEMFSSWAESEIIKFPEMETGPVCPQCGINDSIIINGQQFKCPSCETANHISALHETYDSKRVNFGDPTEDNRTKQYAD